MLLVRGSDSSAQSTSCPSRGWPRLLCFVKASLSTFPPVLGGVDWYAKQSEAEPLVQSWWWYLDWHPWEWHAGEGLPTLSLFRPDCWCNRCRCDGQTWHLQAEAPRSERWEKALAPRQDRWLLMSAMSVMSARELQTAHMSHQQAGWHRLHQLQDSRWRESGQGSRTHARHRTWAILGHFRVRGIACSWHAWRFEPLGVLGGEEWKPGDAQNPLKKQIKWTDKLD